MTPKDIHANCLTLPVMVVDKVFSFSFSRLPRRPSIRSVRRTQAVAQKIYIINALEIFEEARVHIMNFIVADQKLSGEFIL